MKNTSVPIVGGTYSDDTKSWSAQDCVNWLPTQAEKEGTRTPSMLKTPPGLREFVLYFPMSLNGTLANGTKSVPYSSGLTASGGKPPYSGWSVSTGTLPPGLSINGSTGLITGTPT